MSFHSNTLKNKFNFTILTLNDESKVRHFSSKRQKSIAKNFEMVKVVDCHGEEEGGREIRARECRHLFRNFWSSYR